MTKAIKKIIIPPQIETKYKNTLTEEFLMSCIILNILVIKNIDIIRPKPNTTKGKEPIKNSKFRSSRLK